LYGAIYTAEPIVMDKADFKKYFSKALDAEQMHRVEQESQMDPFAFEAMEGYAQMGLNSNDLIDLDTRLKKRVLPEARYAWWKIASMAASIGIILGLFGGWILFGLKNELQPKTVSQNLEMLKSDSSIQNVEQTNTVESEEIPVLEIKEDNTTNKESLSPTVGNTRVETISPSSERTSKARENVSKDNAPLSPKEALASKAPEKDMKRSELKSSPSLNQVPPESKSNAVLPSAPTNSIAVTKRTIKPSPEIVRLEEKTEAKPSIAKSANGEQIKVSKPPIIAIAEKKAKEKTISEEAPYKKAGDEISLSGLTDMLKQDQNETVQSGKADGASAPILAPIENKKQEVFKYDYDKVETQKSKSEINGREKKSKLKIPLDVLPTNITFEDYVRVKLRDKAYKCPKKGMVKLFVNLDKNKKIEDFTILEVNNKVCVDYAKAIVEDWILEKSGMYDENRADQFIINF
jgi:hypothetical protein